MSLEESKKKFSRRDFLIGAGATLGGGMLASCAPKLTPTPTEIATEEAAAAAPAVSPDVMTAEMANKKWSFEVSPDPIPASDISETVEADIVVIGAGVSGLMAGLAAVEAGAKTLLIEKTSTYNARGGHNAALGSKMQKAEGLEYDKGQVVRELSRWGSNKVDQRLLMLWANHCDETIDSLIDMAEAEGIEVMRWGNNIPNEYYSEYSTVHMFGGMDEKILAGMVEKAYLEKGGEIRYDTPAVQLVRENSGRVTGVIASSDDKYIQLNASGAVILCTGDYGNDPEMVERYCPKAADITMNVYAPAVNTGDGHKMGLWIGAAMQEEEPHTPMIHNLGGPPMSSHPFLRVTAAGDRYENEDVPIPYMANSLQLLPDNLAWTVFDSTYAEDVPNLGTGFSRSPVVTDSTVETLDEAVEAGMMAFKADTLDELAEKTGVPADTLNATVARYNELAGLGEDLDFGKSPEMMTFIDTPPFYAVKNPLALLVVLGGFKTTPRLEVVGTDGKVIPGLYAAGNTVGNCFANDYPVIVPGLSHSRALTFGRLAGQFAVENMG